VLAPPVPEDEDQRVAALKSYDILDTAEESIYDAITRAAAEACATPMASLTFIDTDRQWFKARVGIAARESSLDISFCAQAIHQSELFVVQDATADDRFRHFANVAGDPHLRFYAGMPLVDDGGHALGTLCVVDTIPRSLTEQQAETLRLLAHSALRILRLRKHSSVAVFAKAVDMTSDGVTISAPGEEPGGGPTIVYANEAFLRLTGYDYHQVINQACTFPVAPGRTDVQRAFETAYMNGTMATVEAQFENSFGSTLWDRISFVPYVDSRGVLQYVVGIHRDITAQKDMELQANQIHVMRTTLATVDHVIRNFMNAAQLYSSRVNDGQPVEPGLQASFDAAMQKTRQQLTALQGLTSFRDRATPFGVSLLDTEPKQ
jgi:PAS domain S-box-containing protein